MWHFPVSSSEMSGYQQCYIQWEFEYIYIYIMHWWIKWVVDNSYPPPSLRFLFIPSEPLNLKFQVMSFIWHWQLLLPGRDGPVGRTLVVHIYGSAFILYWLDTSDIYLSYIKMSELLKNVLQLSPKYFFLQHFFFFYPSGMYSCLLLWYLNLFCEPAMFDRKVLLIASTYTCRPSLVGMQMDRI